MTTTLPDNRSGLSSDGATVHPSPSESQALRPESGVEQLRIWVVPHTHWDREWYLPFEQFRFHLARTVDDLLDALERDDNLVFTLDGQAVILEDYLEIRPEQEPRLRRLIASGRIAVGPAYVLPDEFLSGPEALIRNLLMGRHVCLRHGAVPMSVAYAPDTFGHIAQLPQILLGFGIDSFVFWRGLGDEAARLGSVFLWQAPDGSRVLAVRLHEGYASARDLGRWTRRDGWVLDDPALWPDTAARRVEEFLERWREPIRRAGLRDVLLGNGVDHEPIQRDLPEMLAACQARLPGTSFRISTYEGYVDALRWQLSDLQIHEGELAGGSEACVVRSVNSTRIYLKQANEAAERALFVAEVLASLACLRARGDGQTGRRGDGGTRHQDPGLSTQHSALSTQGYRYPLNELRLAWRELLRNHPHDSMPGCSLDEAHLDMLQRFRTVRQIAGAVQREALAVLAGQRAGLRPWEDPVGGWSLVNVLPWARARAAELELPAHLRRAPVLVAETPQSDLPVQILGKGAGRRAVVVVDVPGFGARQLRLRRGTSGEGGTRANAGSAFAGSAGVPPALASETAALPGCAIENEFYRVAAEHDGTLTITDRLTGQSWSGLHRLEDVADRGDEYSFCPVEGDAPLTNRDLPAPVRVLASGPWVAELEISLNLRLPAGLRADRLRRSGSAVVCPVRTVVRLAAGIDRIEFRTTVINRARDHRLRVLFPAPGSDLAVRAEGHFALLRRPAEPVWDGRWREPPAKTHHTLGLVSAGHLALMTRGLPEYEAVPNATGGVDLALTLLRCVGWLSWSDLATRPGAEDPHIPTPDAQCLGTHTFEYAVSLRGNAPDADLIRAAQDYRVEMVAGPEGAQLDGVLAVDGEGFAFSALKGAEDGNGIVLRLYNPGAAPAEAHVAGRRVSVHRCRLDETATDPEPLETIALRAGEIVTCRIRKPGPRRVQGAAPGGGSGGVPK